MAAIIISSAQIRAECQDLVDRLAKLIAPGETSQKKRRGEIADMTGIPARRVKDLALGAIKEPPAHQVRTLENALRVAKALARQSALRVEEMEEERAEIENLIMAGGGRAALDRGFDVAHDRWATVSRPGRRNRGLGKA